MSEYIGLINSQQSFTNDKIRVENENTKVQDISETQLGIINANFEYLRKILTEQQRSINYLDIYRIDKVLSDDEINNLPNEFAILSPGHSIGLNGFINYNGETYKKGDIILKLVNGQPLHITGPTGGMFAPLMEADTNTTTIKWYYSPITTIQDTNITYTFLGNSDSEPTLTESGYYVYFNTSDSGQYYLTQWLDTTQSVVWQVWDEAQGFFQYKYTVPYPSEGMLRYNKRFSQSPWTTISFPSISSSNEIIYPVIKYFVNNDGATEEVYCQAHVVLNNDNWEITSIPDYVTYITVY